LMTFQKTGAVRNVGQRKPITNLLSTSGKTSIIPNHNNASEANESSPPRGDSNPGPA
jgi:hypothetical protein